MIKTIIKLKYHKSATTVQKPILKASRMKSETDIQKVPYGQIYFLSQAFPSHLPVQHC